MCNPMAIASIGAQLAATKIQNDKYKQANRERSDAIDYNSVQRKFLEQEGRDATMAANAMFDQDNFGSGMQSNEEKLAQLLGSINTPNYSIPRTGNVPRVVSDEINRQKNIAQAFNKQQQEAQAKLANLGDYLATTINPSLNRSAEKVAMSGNFLQGQADLLDGELKSAERVAYSPEAQILGNIGTLGTAYGLAKV